MTAELLNFAQGLFVWMLVLSVQIVFILLIRKPLARYFGATVAYRLWLLPLLWLPLHWVDWSRFNWSLLLPEFLWAGSAGGQGSVSWFPLVSRGFDAVLEFPEQAFSLNGSGSMALWLTIAVLWFGVAALLMGGLLVKMRHFSRQLPRLSKSPAAAQAPALQDSPFLPGVAIRTIPGLGSPALYGVLRPQLLLPEDFEQRFTPRQRALILAHEAVHYRRRDNLWNLLACTLRLLFWFNPLLHLAWRQYRLDQEMSCDEQALQQAQQDEGKQYARTLVESVVRTTEAGTLLGTDALPTLTSWGRLSEIKERTRMIHFHLHRKPHVTQGKLLLPLLAAIIFVTTASLSGHLEKAVAAESQETLTRSVYEVIERVMAHREAEEYDEAERLLDELEVRVERGELNNRETQVVFQFQANLAQIRSEYEVARDYYERILELPNLSPQIEEQTLTQVGSLNYLLEDYNAALDDFLQLLEKFPDSNNSRGVHLRISYAYYFLEQPEQAIIHAEAARDLGDTALNTLQLLQNLYEQTGNTEKASELSAAIAAAAPEESSGAVDIDVIEEDTPREYLPIVVIQPQYPNSALQGRIEGFAVVSFTVDESGGVVDPVIVESSPEGIFDEASLRAVARFKFNPRLEDGVAVQTPGVRYVFRFNLSDD